MVEKVQLNLWDFFVYVLSGTAVCCSVAIHAVVVGAVPLKRLEDIPSALTVILFLLCILIVGLLLEPIANMGTKFLSALMKCITTLGCSPLKKWWHDEFSFGKWDEQLSDKQSRASEHIPESIRAGAFQYCKNWLHQNGKPDLYLPFLAKFGFYRNIAFILLVNAIGSACLYQWNMRLVLSVVGILAFALLYAYRGQVYYRHITETVFSQFISCHESTERKGSGE